MGLLFRMLLPPCLVSAISECLTCKLEGRREALVNNPEYISLSFDTPEILLHQPAQHLANNQCKHPVWLLILTGDLCSQPAPVGWGQRLSLALSRPADHKSLQSVKIASHVTAGDIKSRDSRSLDHRCATGGDGLHQVDLDVEGGAGAGLVYRLKRAGD